MKRTHAIFGRAALGILAASCILLAVPAAASGQSKGSESAKRPFESLVYPKLNAVHPPKVLHDTLPNGMKLLLVEDHELPQVKFRAIVKGGTVAEPSGKRGLSELFGDVQRSGGTQAMSGDDADVLLDRIGASIDSSMGEAYGTLRGSCLTESLDKVLPLFGDFLMHPAFREKKVELAKTHLNSLISRRNDTPMQIAMREFGKLVYGASSPYARQIEYDDVAKLTRQDLLAFHKRFYRPDGTILAVWGDFNAPDMKTKLAEIFGGWTAEGPKPAVAPPFVFPPQASLNYAEKKGAAQTIVLLGHLGVRMDNPDYPAILMMNDILGGGFNSRIFKKVRTEKGLAYGAGGAITAAFDHPGALYLYTATKPKTTVEALNLVVEEVNRIRKEPVTDHELDMAKKGYLNAYPFQFDSVGKIVNRIMTYDFYGYPEDFNERIRSGVEKVTKEDVLRVAQKYLHPDRFATLVVGDASTFGVPLSTVGKVTTLDITIPEPAPKEVIPDPTPATLKAGTALLETAARARGEKALLSLEDMTAEGNTTMKTGMGEMELKTKSVIIFPDKVRSDLQTPMGAMVQVLNGDTGWYQMGPNTKDIPSSMIGKMKTELYAVAGCTLILQKVLKGELQGQAIGDAKFEGQAAKDVLVKVGKDSLRLYLSPDGKTLLGLKQRVTGREGPQEQSTVYSDWKTFSGLSLPTKSVRKVKGEVKVTSTVTGYALNPGARADLFNKPQAPDTK